MASPMPDGVGGDAKRVLAQQVSMLSPTQPIHVHTSPALRRRTMSGSGNKDKSMEKKAEKTFSNLLRLIPGDDGSSIGSPVGTPTGTSLSPLTSNSGNKKDRVSKRRSILSQDAENYSPGTPEVKRRSKNAHWLLKHSNVVAAFGKNLLESGTAQKALWLGSTILRGKDTSHAHAWDAVRGVLRHGTSEATKVYIVASRQCIGAVEAKVPHIGKKGSSLPLIHLKEDPENVTKVLSEHDSTDGMLIAYVTESKFFKFNHVHVFGMKREEDGYDIVTALRKMCNLTGDVGRLWKMPDRRSRVDSEASETNADEDSETHSGASIHGSSVGQTETLLVEFLGEAAVSSDAWWRRTDTVLRDTHLPLSKQDTNSTFQRCIALYGELLVRPAALTTAEAALFSEEVALVVRSDRVVVYSMLTQEALVTISTSAIKAVRKGNLPEHVYEALDPVNTAASATNPADAISVESMQLSEQQRIAVMASVKSGKVSVVDAMEIALQAENRMREDTRMKVVSVCFKDDQVGSSTVVSFLVRGLRAADAVLDAIAKARKNAKIANLDPFAPLVGQTEDSTKRRQSTEKLQEHELDRDTLTAVEHLGNGEFGEVYLANHVVGTETANNGDEVDVEEKRAVKTLRPDLPQHIAKTFASEALLHVGLKHQNIVNVVGVCMVQQPYLFVLEYCMYGDLRKVLKTFKSRELELTLGEQAHILAQIADAMAYITKSRIAHMDLASRNVLVHQGTTMKVADFGLAHRYTKKKDHYALRGKIRLPFLWVPPECLPCSMWDATVKTPYEPRFNEQTDMWSFGVLIWEVLNYGDIPYNFGENLKPILEKIYNGLRLDPPYQCHSVFASALTRAFAESGHRPKFVDLKNELAAVVNDPEQNLHGVRDLGKVLNAPLESNVEKLTQIVSMRRRHSKAMLQMRERRKSQADFDPMQMAAAVQKIQHEEATVARELATSPIKSISSAAGLGWNSAASDYHVINEEHPDEALHAVDSSHPSCTTSDEVASGFQSDSSHEIVRGFGSDTSAESRASENPSEGNDGTFIDASQFFNTVDGVDPDADDVESGDVPRTPRSRQRRPSEVVFDPSMWALSPEGKLVREATVSGLVSLQESADGRDPHSDPAVPQPSIDADDAYVDVSIDGKQADAPTMEQANSSVSISATEENRGESPESVTNSTGGNTAEAGQQALKHGPPVAPKTKHMPTAQAVVASLDTVTQFNFREYVDYYSSSDDESPSSAASDAIPQTTTATARSGTSDLDDSFTAVLKSEAVLMDEDDCTKSETRSNDSNVSPPTDGGVDLSGRKRGTRSSVQLMANVLTTIGNNADNTKITASDALPVNNPANDTQTSVRITAYSHPKGNGTSGTPSAESVETELAVVEHVTSASSATESDTTESAVLENITSTTSTAECPTNEPAEVVTEGTSSEALAMSSVIAGPTDAVASASDASSATSVLPEPAVVGESTSNTTAAESSITEPACAVASVSDASAAERAITVHAGVAEVTSSPRVTGNVKVDATVIDSLRDPVTDSPDAGDTRSTRTNAVQENDASSTKHSLSVSGGADHRMVNARSDGAAVVPSTSGGSATRTADTPAAADDSPTNTNDIVCDTAFPRSLSLDTDSQAQTEASHAESQSGTGNGTPHVFRSVSEGAVKRKVRRTNRLQSILDSLGHSDV